MPGSNFSANAGFQELKAANVTLADLLLLRNMTNKLNATSLCVGSTCLNETDVQGIKNYPITQVACNGQECLNSTDVSRVKNLPQSVNSTRHCIGPDCMVSTDLTTLKTLPSIVNSSLICSGPNCLNLNDVAALKTLVSTLTNPIRAATVTFKEITVSSTSKTFVGCGPLCLNGLASTSMFSSPKGLTIAPNGTIYVADSVNNIIRDISPNGDVSTVAGVPFKSGYFDGPAQSALFNIPGDIKISQNGTFYVADSFNHCIRSISPSGEVSTVAGTNSTGSTDGPGHLARFNTPQRLSIAPNGTIYVADTFNHRIRAISPSGMVTTVAGSSFGFANGFGTNAQFYNPNGVYAHTNGSVFVADYSNRRVRMISPSGNVSTVAGTGATGSTDGPALSAAIDSPLGLVMASNGTLYIVCEFTHNLRALSPNGIVTTVAGNASSSGLVDGQGLNAKFKNPAGIAIGLDGSSYISDSVNNRIRKVSTSGVVSTYAGSSNFADGQLLAARFNSPRGAVIAPNGTIYVTDSTNQLIRSVSPTGVVSTLAGSTQGYADGQGTAAQFNFPSEMAISPNGTVFVADTSNHRIRAISPSGYVSTVAGTGANGFVDGPALNASFNQPYGLALSPNGTLYVSETSGYRIRAISPNGIVSTVAGNTTSGSQDGVGMAARFGFPRSMALSPNGTLFVTDRSNNRIRAISPNGTVTTFVGPTFMENGLNKTFTSPTGLALAPNGVLYVTDSQNHILRSISPSGNVTTLAAGFGHTVGSLSTTTFYTPSGLALFPNGTLLIVEQNANRILTIEP